MEAEQDTAREYFPALDGLRLLCCSWVILAHGYVGHPSSAYLSGLSGMGVHVFFALSGFLITKLLLTELRTTGKLNLRAFYWRRAIRIFPVYFAAVGLSLAGLVFLGQRFARPFGAEISAIDLPKLALTHLFFVANWFKQAQPTSLEVLWSISVEEQFYIVFPFALLLLATRPRITAGVVVGILVCWVVRARLSASSPDEIYRNTLATGDHLLMGAGLALLTSSKRFPRWIGTPSTTSEVFALLLVLGTSVFGPRTGPGHFISGTLSALSSAWLVGCLAFGDGALSRALAWSPFRRLGQLTYATYVFHMWALALAWFATARLTSDIAIAAPVRTALAFGLAFALGYASKKLLEEPAQRLRPAANNSPLATRKAQE